MDRLLSDAHSQLWSLQRGEHVTCAGVQMVFFFLYGNMQVAFAFLLSCFFTNTRVANISTWIWVLGAGLFAGNFLDSVFIDDDWWSLPLQFIPTFGAFRSGPGCNLKLTFLLLKRTTAVP